MVSLPAHRAVIPLKLVLVARSRAEATTRYDPAEAEARIFEDWFDGGVLHPAAEGTPEENYSIAIPPPNVTGALHMGHALNGTIQDC